MEILTETLNDELAKRGLDNELLSFSLQKTGSVERAPGSRQTRIPCRWKLFTLPIPTWKGVRLIREKIANADIVHVNYPNPIGAFLGAWFARRAGKPLAVSVMSQIGVDPSSGDRGLAYRALAWLVNAILLRYAASRADVLFIPSPGYAAVNPHIAKHEARATLLPLGADLTRFHPGLPRDHVRRKHGIDGRIVLFLGSLKPTHRGKGLPILLEAMRTLRQGREDVRLVIAADGEMEAEYMALAHKLGVRDIIVHAKGVPRYEVPLYFAGADVFTLPSTWLEAFGLVLAEAMASGTPVVGTRMGGIPYVIGDAGALVEPGDAQALAHALARVLDDPEAAREMAKRGRARVEEMFHWDNTARIAHEAYERALAARGERTSSS